MKRTIITTIAAMAFSAMFIQAADAAKPEGEKKKANPEEAWKKMNPEGKESLTKDEFSAKAKDKAKAEATFAKKDANNDGKLTKEEFLAHGKKAK